MTIHHSKVTLSFARGELSKLGFSISRTDDAEYRVAPRWLRGAAAEFAAYYTADLADALGTGRLMARDYVHPSEIVARLDASVMGA